MLYIISYVRIKGDSLVVLMSEALWVHFNSIYLFPTKKVLHINKNIFLQGILSFLLKPPNVVNERKLSQETHAGGTILNVLLTCV